MVSSSWPPIASVPPSSSNRSSPISDAYGSPENTWQSSYDNLTEYESLSLRINPPRVVFDNSTDPDSTLLTVDSANRHGCLLEVVQLLTDLDLNINKAEISSDGGWFVDVFYVKDQKGRKLMDKRLTEHIRQVLGAKTDAAAAGPPAQELRTCLGRSISIRAGQEYTALELTGQDRPGLLSDVSSVLTAHGCNVAVAEVWTHNHRVAFVVYVNDKVSGQPISDPSVLTRIKEKLNTVMHAENERQVVESEVTIGSTHRERRLHQMLLQQKDYEEEEKRKDSYLSISIRNCAETQYCIVDIKCRDRPKLLFDTVCTLTDMQYVVFHATIGSQNGIASQEFYIRHMDGSTLDSEEETNMVAKCLEAAIRRRTPEGLRFELRTCDRVGLLSDVTKKFQEKGLNVTMADVATDNGQVVNTFYVANASGTPIDGKVVDSLRRDIGYSNLQVKDTPAITIPGSQSDDKSKNSFLHTLRSHSERWLGNLGFGSFSPPSSNSMGSPPGSASDSGTKWW